MLLRLLKLQFNPKNTARFCHPFFESFLGLITLLPLWSNLGNAADPRKTKLVHLNRQLEKVIETLTLRLRLVDIITPHIDAMTPHQDGIRIRILLHSSLKILRQVLLMRRVLNNRNTQRIMVSQVTHLPHALAKTFNLLNVVDLEDAAALCLEEQGDEDGPVGVGVDAATGAAAGEGGEEEGRALGGLVERGGAEVGSLLEGGFLVFEGEDVDVGGFHEFLLDAGGGDVDEVVISNGTSSSSAGNPSQGPELGAQRRDEVGRMLRVRRRNELIRVLMSSSHCEI